MPSLLSLVHGLSDRATGFRAVLDARSFQAATGPKADRWRARTVAALTIASGATLAVAHRRSAPVYLLDAWRRAARALASR